MQRYLTPNLTSYDLLKSLAVLLMLLDHVGYFFFPENEWFRVIGRASMPVWFFLAGFARSRDIPKLFWIAALSVVAANIIAGGTILPLNVIFVFILIRYGIDFITSVAFRNWEVLAYSTFLITALNVLFYNLLEYGTLGLLIAMCGYMVRHWGSLNLTDQAKKIFMGFVAGSYALIQVVTFHNSMEKFEMQAMVVVIGAVSLLLYLFQPKEVPEIESKLPRFLVSALQFGGRYTLEIYTVHIIIFILASTYLGVHSRDWFEFALIR